MPADGKMPHHLVAGRSDAVPPTCVKGRKTRLRDAFPRSAGLRQDSDWRRSNGSSAALRQDATHKGECSLLAGNDVAVARLSKGRLNQGIVHRSRHGQFAISPRRIRITEDGLRGDDLRQTVRKRQQCRIGIVVPDPRQALGAIEHRLPVPQVSLRPHRQRRSGQRPSQKDQQGQTAAMTRYASDETIDYNAANHRLQCGNLSCRLLAF